MQKEGTIAQSAAAGVGEAPSRMKDGKGEKETISIDTCERSLSFEGGYRDGGGRWGGERAERREGDWRGWGKMRGKSARKVCVAVRPQEAPVETRTVHFFSPALPLQCVNARDNIYPPQSRPLLDLLPPAFPVSTWVL